ncbi:MAG: TolC family protein [Myxococcales bacterium]|nr:TolC family protein [Myxococcales bacterium]
MRIRSHAHCTSARYVRTITLVASLCAAIPASAQETLDLEALIVEALRNHPELKRVREGAAAAHELPSQARSLPDPLFRFSASNFLVDDPGLDSAAMTGLVLGIVQPFPFPGKLPKRRDVAEAQAKVSDRGVELLEALIIERVQRAYWQLHFAERALQITELNVEVINTLTNVVHARFAVGQAAQQDALQAQVAHSRLRADLKERKQAARSARRALNGAVGRPPDDVLPPTGALDRSPRAMNRMTLVKALLSESPFLELARSKVHREEEGVREATYDRAPDLLVGASYRFRGVVPGDPTEGTDMFSVTFGLSLPIWARGKQKARIREVRYRLAEARAMEDGVVLETTTRLERLLDAVERLNEEIELYQRELLPEADLALDASISDYQAARVGFVSVLRNWDTELELQIAHERLLADREERLAEVEALTGALLERLKP